VNITQVFTVNKSDLGEKIGTLSAQRFERFSKGSIRCSSRESMIQSRVLGMS